MVKISTSTSLLLLLHPLLPLFYSCSHAMPLFLITERRQLSADLPLIHPHSIIGEKDLQ